jgi:hypothetical protein
MDKASQMLVVPALLTLDIVVVAAILVSPVSGRFSSTISLASLAVVLLIADLMVGELAVHYWDRPQLVLASTVPSRVELSFIINGKPAKRELNMLSVKVANVGRRAAQLPAVVIDGVNLARGGPHTYFDVNREFHHPTFMPLQTVSPAPSERELAYVVFQACKEVVTVEGGDQGSFMIGFSFAQDGKGERARVYLPSESNGEPYPLLPYESWYVSLFAQFKGTKIRPISKERFILKGSEWDEPILSPTTAPLDKAEDEYRAARYAESATGQAGPAPLQSSD